MPKGSPLNRYAKSMRAPTEQAGYRKRVRRAVKGSAAAPASVGRITASERKAVRQLGRAVKLTTTAGEARGVRKIARRKARKS